MDKEPIAINGKSCEAGSKFYSGSTITNWNKCTYFMCRTVKKYNNKYYRYLIAKADYTKVNRSSLGSYISTLKPLSSRGSIEELRAWLKRDWYAINDGTGDTDIVFEVPFPESNSNYVLSFTDNLGEHHSFDLNPKDGSITIPMTLFYEYISGSQKEFIVSIEFKPIDDESINLTQDLHIIFLQ